MFGGIMAIQSLGEMAGRSATNAPPADIVRPAVPPKVRSLNTSTSRAEDGDQKASARAINPPATDKETADMLAINIILNGYGCHKVKGWHGDGFGGKNIVTCVERKGRSRIARYEVDALEGSAVML